MPKMKTHKSASKRFKRTGSGKLKRNHSGRRHLMDCKSRKRKRKLRSSGLVHEADLHRYDQLIP